MTTGPEWLPKGRNTWEKKLLKPENIALSIVCLYLTGCGALTTPDPANTSAEFEGTDRKEQQRGYPYFRQIKNPEKIDTGDMALTSYDSAEMYSKPLRGGGLVSEKIVDNRLVNGKAYKAGIVYSVAGRKGAIMYYSKKQDNMLYYTDNRAQTFHFVETNATADKENRSSIYAVYFQGPNEKRNVITVVDLESGNSHDIDLQHAGLKYFSDAHRRGINGCYELKVSPGSGDEIVAFCSASDENDNREIGALRINMSSGKPDVTMFDYARHVPQTLPPEIYDEARQSPTFDSLLRLVPNSDGTYQPPEESVFSLLHQASSLKKQFDFQIDGGGNGHTMALFPVLNGNNTHFTYYNAANRNPNGRYDIFQNGGMIGVGDPDAPVKTYYNWVQAYRGQQGGKTIGGIKVRSLTWDGAKVEDKQLLDTSGLWEARNIGESYTVPVKGDPGFAIISDSIGPIFLEEGVKDGPNGPYIQYVYPGAEDEKGFNESAGIISIFLKDALAPYFTEDYYVNGMGVNITPDGTYLNVSYATKRDEWSTVNKNAVVRVDALFPQMRAELSEFQEDRRETNQ